MKQYRLLNQGEIICSTDEFYSVVDYKWDKLGIEWAGKTVKETFSPIRREIKFN